MKLYHGSNMPIERIDLTKAKPHKDFGQGFYLSDKLEQAREMAKQKVIMSGEGEPTVTTFEFDENLLKRIS